MIIAHICNFDAHFEMRGIRSDRSKRYTPVPQALSDEDEGVYDDSPESSPHTELLSTACLYTDTNCTFDRNTQVSQREIKTVSLCGTSYSACHQSDNPPPLALIGISTSEKSSKMSCSRLACFIMSILICVLYMVALLWLLPCHFAPCLPKSKHDTAPTINLREWNGTFNNIRFVSKPKLVQVDPAGKTVLLSVFRHISHESSIPPAAPGKMEKSSSSSSGVIALQAEDGQESWRLPYYTDIADLVCDVTDVNKDGFNECIIVGSTGLLAAVNASNGYIFWYLHNHNERHAVEMSVISVPCQLPDVDLDQDGVKDFAVVGLVTPEENHSRESSSSSSPFLMNSSPSPTQYVTEQIAHVLLVSGNNGQIAGRLVHAVPIVRSSHASVSVGGQASLPLLTAYDFGNGSKSLMMLLSRGDGIHTNGTAILMTSLDEHLRDISSSETTCQTNDTASTASTSGSIPTLCSKFVEIYSGSGDIVSFRLLQNDKKSLANVLVVENDFEQLVCLSGPNGFQPVWTYKVSSGSKISQPAFGRFNDDDTLDVFVSVSVTDCLATSDCRSKVVILDGDTGRELAKVMTECRSFGPLVLKMDPSFSSDIFMFKTILSSKSSASNRPLLEVSSLKVVKTKEQDMIYHPINTYDNGTTLSAYEISGTEETYWNPNENCSRTDDDGQSLQSCFVETLLAFSRESKTPLWEINLFEEATACYGNKAISSGTELSETGTVFQANLKSPFLISFSTDSTQSRLITFNLGLKISKVRLVQHESL